MAGQEGDVSARLLPPRPDGEEGENTGLAVRVWAEKKKLWVVAAPAIFTRFSTFGVSVISQAFMGHIGATELAAYALVFTVTVRFANGILLGMSSALETLCGQSFGAGQYHMLGVYLQRSWLVLLPFTVALLPLFLFSTPLLRLLGQDEGVALMAGTVSLWCIPAIFSFPLSFTLQMYLQSQSKNRVISYWAAVSLGTHILLSWVLAMKLNLGVAGVMGSTVIALWIPVFGQLLFVFCGGCPDTWKGFSSAAFQDLWPVVKLSFSSGVMLCLEVWYNTILVLLTGHMQNAEIAIDALSICLSINGWEMMISLGFLAAAGVRVANELGAGSAKNAKFSIIVTVTTSLAIGFILFVVFLLLRGRVSYIFSKSVEVAEAVSGLSTLLAFSILLNSVQPVLSGVAVGAGLQSMVAYVNIVCYYFIGIPLGVVLSYVTGFGVKGIWMGMISGTAIQTLVLIFITVKTDWEHQVDIAQARVKKWFLPKSESKNGSTEAV
uniref:Protein DETOXIFICATION n=1 Tax=Anthurium amnicola TaxID=1678845 RepID=A0A1D1YEK0_9ARAE